MFKLIVSCYICVNSLKKTYLRRYFLFGVLAIMSFFLDIVRPFATEYILLSELLWSVDVLLTLAIGGYAVWVFRKDDDNA